MGEDTERLVLDDDLAVRRSVGPAAGRCLGSRGESERMLTLIT